MKVDWDVVEKEIQTVRPSDGLVFNLKAVFYYDENWRAYYNMFFSWLKDHLWDGGGIIIWKEERARFLVLLKEFEDK